MSREHFKTCVQNRRSQAGVSLEVVFGSRRFSCLRAAWICWDRGHPAPRFPSSSSSGSPAPPGTFAPFSCAPRARDGAWKKVLGTSSPPYPRRGARVRRLRLRGAQRRPHAAEISSRLLEGANPEGGSLQPPPRPLPRCRGRPDPGCRPIRTSASACASLQPLIAGLRPGPPPRGWRAPGRGEPEERWGRVVFLRPTPPPVVRRAPSPRAGTPKEMPRHGPPLSLLEAPPLQLGGRVSAAPGGGLGRAPVMWAPGP